MLPLLANVGPTELFIILGILVLLFGATKLPELARGSGRALRIFKTETRGLLDDDPSEGLEVARPDELASRRADLDRRQANLDAERRRLREHEG